MKLPGRIMSLENELRCEYARLITRRWFFRQCGVGLGSIALSSLLAPENASGATASAVTNPLAPKQPHFKPRAKRVIFLFMSGGVSHVDSFDYKPSLIEQDGKMLDFQDLRSLAKTGKSPQQRVMKPLWN